MKVVMCLGGELDIFVRGSVYFFEGCNEDLCIFFFFSSFIDTLFLHFDSKPCTYVDIYIYIYIEVVTAVSPISSCVVSFLSLCTCFLLLYAIFYFCFTLRCLNEFYLKYFKNTGCQSLLAINSLLAKFFKSLC